jgi:hypothetical protein
MEEKGRVTLEPILSPAQFLQAQKLQFKPPYNRLDGLISELEFDL